MSTTDLELTIARAVDGATTADLRVTLPGRRADLAMGVPLDLDDTLLLSMATRPALYGASLSEMVFAPALREAWQRALGYAEGAGERLRLRLSLEGDDGLHAIRWELLRDPLRATPLAYRETVALSRYLGSDHLGPIHAAGRPQLRAVVAVSAAAGPGMAAVDVAGEVARARAGLGHIPATVLDGRAGRPGATLAALADALRGEAHILYLVCHGALAQGQPYLYLERPAGQPDRPIPGADLVRQIADLARRPLLVVLASCQGAGDTYHTLAAVGPQLARAGVGAVIAMQGDVPMELVAALTPRLFAELGRDGQIDRALAAARAALPADSPWWMPALWMAVSDGALWREEPRAPQTSPAPDGGIHVGGNVGTVQVLNISGGTVNGPIIGSQTNYGAPPAHTDHAEGLRRRLAQHRATLAHYLGQLAITGSANAHPEVTHGIREARAEIRRIKVALRGMGQAVENQMDDED
jgi:hypothetical protein